MKEVDVVKKSSYTDEQYTQCYNKIRELGGKHDYSAFNQKIYTKA
jgi:hypothetical protein